MFQRQSQLTAKQRTPKTNTKIPFTIHNTITNTTEYTDTHTHYGICISESEVVDYRIIDI